MPSIFLGIILLAGIVPVMAGPLDLNWNPGPSGKISDSDGQKILQVAVRLDSPRLTEKNCAEAPIDLRSYAGKTLRFSLPIRFLAVTRPKNPNHGIRYQFFARTGSGKKIWNNCRLETGNSDWRVATIVQAIPADVTEGRFFLGLLGSSGTVEFNLSRFTAEVVTLLQPQALAGPEKPLLGAQAMRWCPGARLTGNILTVTVPSGSPAARDKNCVALVFDAAKFIGREPWFYINLRQSNVVALPGVPGAAIRFQIESVDGAGKQSWDNAETLIGNSGWLQTSCGFPVGAGTKTVTLHMGMIGCTGKVEFDLATFRISFPAELDETRSELAPTTRAEFVLVQKRMRAKLLVTPPPAPQRVAAIQTALKPDGSFVDVDYQDCNKSDWKTFQHLARAGELAQVYANPADEKYRNPEIAQAIRKIVNQWTRLKPRSNNWWFNMMAVPDMLAGIMLLTPEIFPEEEERQAIFAEMRQAQFIPRFTTGNNRVFVASIIFKRGILESKTGVVAAAVDVIKDEIRFVDPEAGRSWRFGGLRVDGCYQQHGPQIQFGNYGMQFLTYLAYWSDIWQGTPWQFTPGQWEIVHHLVFNGYQWVLWNAKLDITACGRQISRQQPYLKGRGILDTIRKLRDTDPNFKAAYDAVISRNTTGNNTLVGNRHFWNSDYMIHRRPTWYAALRMNSSRVAPVETGNWDNALGRYASDGICLITRTGMEYNDITPCWDWTRLPGATLPATPVYDEKACAQRNLKDRWSFGLPAREIGETDFVGGVSDGVLGAAVFTQNIDGVKAKKAWFFDRNAIYALGNSITGTVSREVATVLDSRLAATDVLAGPGYVCHDRTVYLGENLKYEVVEREGDWRIVDGGLAAPVMDKKKLFNLRIDHGVRPSNAAYAYTIVPDAMPEQAKTLAPAKVLSNTPELQAVEFSDGTYGAIFHAPGKLRNFETRIPGLVLIGKDRLYFAEPTGKFAEAILVWNGTARKIALPRGELAGKSVEIVK